MREKKGDYKTAFYTLLVLTTILLIDPIALMEEPERPPEIVLTSNSNDYTLIELLNTGSMKPLVKGESAMGVAVIPNKKDIKLGNILAYETDYGGLVTHRVVAIDGETYYMKGDSSDDFELIEFDDIEFKVIAVIN